MVSASDVAVDKRLYISRQSESVVKSAYVSVTTINSTCSTSESTKTGHFIMQYWKNFLWRGHSHTPPQWGGIWGSAVLIFLGMCLVNNYYCACLRTSNWSTTHAHFTFYMHVSNLTTTVNSTCSTSKSTKTGHFIMQYWKNFLGRRWLPAVKDSQRCINTENPM